MARNSEKANAMLNKWLRIKSGLEQEQVLRPRHTAEVTNLKEAEKWRSATIKEIMFNINKIQDGSLGEFVVRDLNDEINRLIGIRKHWDDRIIELGGTDYRRLSANLESSYGAELKIGGSGYKYFGAAKNLPGVRELFEQQQKEVEQSLKDVSRAELYRMIRPDYYGFNDEQDEELLLQEYNKEQELLHNNLVIAAVLSNLRAFWRSLMSLTPRALARDSAGSLREGLVDTPVALDSASAFPCRSLALDQILVASVPLPT